MATLNIAKTHPARQLSPGPMLSRYVVDHLLPAWSRLGFTLGDIGERSTYIGFACLYFPRMRYVCRQGRGTFEAAGSLFLRITVRAVPPDALYYSSENFINTWVYSPGGSNICVDHEACEAVATIVRDLDERPARVLAAGQQLLSAMYWWLETLAGHPQVARWIGAVAR